MINWETVTEHFKAKKEKWANTDTYYTPKTKWGDKYGQTLAPPYSVQEVEEYEKNHLKCRIPAQLRCYLIKVSREIFASSYPVIFYLKCNCDLTEARKAVSENLSAPITDLINQIINPVSPSCGGWSLPADCTFIDYEDDLVCPKHSTDDDDHECDYDIDCKMSTVGDGGCTFYDHIMLDGPQAGTIWSSDGERTHRSHKSFFEYLKITVQGCKNI